MFALVQSALANKGEVTQLQRSTSGKGAGQTSQIPVTTEFKETVL